MRDLAIIWTLVVCNFLLFNQYKADGKLTGTTPIITDTQKAAYWKASANQQSIQSALAKAQQDLQQAVQAMIEVCGKSATLTVAPNGDPVCTANPEPAKPVK